MWYVLFKTRAGVLYRIYPSYQFIYEKNFQNKCFISREIQDLSFRKIHVWLYHIKTTATVVISFVFSLRTTNVLLKLLRNMYSLSEHSVIIRSFLLSRPSYKAELIPGASRYTQLR